MATRTGLMPAAAKLEGKVKSTTFVRKSHPATNRCPSSEAIAPTSVKVRHQNIVRPRYSMCESANKKVAPVKIPHAASVKTSVTAPMKTFLTAPKKTSITVQMKTSAPAHMKTSSTALKKPVTAHMKSAVISNTRPTTFIKKNHNQTGQAAKVHSLKRKTDSSFEPGRTAAKQKSLNRDCHATEHQSPKSILKKKPDIEETNIKSETVECVSSRHVKFRSKTATDQTSLRAKLNEWLMTKGKTPARCRHLGCFSAETSARKESGASVDRTITQHLLTEQLKVLKDENVKRTLFPSAAAANGGDDCVSDADNKENVPCEVVVEELVGSTEDVEQDQAETDGADQELDLGSPTKPAHTMNPEIAARLTIMLEDCLTLFKEGCSQENVMLWLQEIAENIPSALTFAPYYICKARVLESSPQKVLDVLCEAVRNAAQPCDQLATEMKAILSKLMAPAADNAKRTGMSDQDPTQLMDQPSTGDHVTEKDPSPSSDVPFSSTSLSRRGRPATEGSVLKFNITTTSHLIKRTSESAHLTVVTPVRRSARLSHRQSTPGSALRRDLNSVSDLSSAERQSALFRKNLAITGK